MAPVTRMDIKHCTKKMPPHPCDPPEPCDPWKKEGGVCPEPFLCQEKIKNPAIIGETTQCKPGASIPAKRCGKQMPPHPCDPRPPCSTWSEEQKRRRPDCEDVTLCRERIKNPADDKKPLACDPDE